MVHCHHSLLEVARLHSVDLNASLVPLERVHALGNVRDEAVFDVVIKSEVPLNQVIEVIGNLIRVLVKQAF
jgi:hypothetical protein